MRRRRRRRHPRRIPDRSHRRDRGQAVRPVRPRRCGVLRAVGLSVVAWPRRRRPRSAAGPADGALPAVTHRAHHAGLPGCGRGDSFVAARRQGRSHGVAGEPVADPDLRAADPDRGADPDVEPVGRGRLLPGAAVPCTAGATTAGAGPDPGHRRGGGRQLRVAAHPLRHAVRRQSVQLATSLLLLVRGGHAARRADGDPDRVAAPTGPAPGADGRHRGRRFRCGGIAPGGHQSG